MTNPVLTIVSITYNQEKYITQALESFIMQKTDFPFEVIISDDCSTDGTVNIIKEYAEKYPDIIKPIFRNKNIGIIPNFIDSLSKAKSQYVALCEGDDYWTDPDKLQKQVNFLDTHLECSICFHPVSVHYEGISRPDEVFPSPQMRFDKDILTVEHLLCHNFIQTNSVMYRWRFNDKESIYDVFPEDILPGDYFLHLLHAQKGKIGFINDVMSVYRRQKGGIWWDTTTNIENLHLKHGVQELKFYIELEKTFPEYVMIKGSSSTNNVANMFLNIYLKHQKFQEMKEVMDLCPNFLSFSQKISDRVQNYD